MLGFEQAAMDRYYVMKRTRDLRAREQYAEEKRNRKAEDIYMLDIMRGRVSEEYQKLFLVSRISKQFGQGNPTYVAGLTQRLLAEQAGVSLRQIQLFKQRERDINKCQGQTLQNLARVLCCRVEDLLEKEENSCI